MNLKNKLSHPVPVQSIDKATFCHSERSEESLCHSERSEESQRCFVPQHDKRCFVPQHDKRCFVPQHDKRCFLPQHDKWIRMTLIIICVIAFMMVSCSDSDKDKEDKTFNLTVNYEQFRENVNLQYGSAPIVIEVFYYNEDTSYREFTSDSPLYKDTYQIPETAVLFGVIAKILNENNTIGTFDDWAVVSYQFVLNSHFTEDYIERLVPFYVEDDFKRFNEVEAVVVGINERIGLFFNGEEVDLDDRVIPVTKADPPGPDDVKDTYEATEATVENSIRKAFNTADAWGSRYKIRFDENSGNDVQHHVQGMGWYRDRYAIFTHSANPDDHYNPKIYMVNTNNNTSVSIDAKCDNDMLWHPGGGQVIENYFVFSGVKETDGGIYKVPLTSFNSDYIDKIYHRSYNEDHNSAAGVTKVKSEFRYGSTDTVGSDYPQKYIIALVSYVDKYIILFRSTPVSGIYNVTESNLTEIGRYYYGNLSGLLNNIALFTEHDGNIMMVAFDSDSYSGNSVDIKLYQITTKNETGGYYEIANTPMSVPVKTMNIDEEWFENMNGRWGATGYFDGEKMHIFMTNRTADAQLDFSYNHW